MVIAEFTSCDRDHTHMYPTTLPHACIQAPSQQETVSISQHGPFTSAGSHYHDAFVGAYPSSNSEDA